MGEANQSEDTTAEEEWERGNNEDEDANTYHTAAGRAGISIIIGTTSTVSSTFCQ